MKKSKFRKAKYSGMSELKRMKELEKENGRLKQMYADLRPEYQALKDIVEKSYKTWETRVILGTTSESAACPGSWLCI